MNLLGSEKELKTCNFGQPHKNITCELFLQKNKNSITSSPETLKHKFQDARDSLKISNYHSYLKKPEKEKHLIIGWERICQAVLFIFFKDMNPVGMSLQLPIPELQILAQKGCRSTRG